jgi:hypothetical protein
MRATTSGESVSWNYCGHDEKLTSNGHCVTIDEENIKN